MIHLYQCAKKTSASHSRKVENFSMSNKLKQFCRLSFLTNAFEKSLDTSRSASYEGFFLNGLVSEMLTQHLAKRTHWARDLAKQDNCRAIHTWSNRTKFKAL